MSKAGGRGRVSVGEVAMRRLFAIHQIHGVFPSVRSDDEHRRERAKNARDPSREHSIEPGVRSVVAALNRLAGIATYASCGGHPRPFSWQMPAGTFSVSFEVARTPRGWSSLERVADAVASIAPGAVLSAWAARRAGLPLAFELRGGREDARAIVRALAPRRR